MTELAELVERLRIEADAYNGRAVARPLREAAEAIERLEREREGLRFSAEYAEAQRQAAESRALTAEAQLEKVREQFSELLVYSFEDDPGTLILSYAGEKLASIDIDTEAGSVLLKLEQEIAERRALSEPDKEGMR